MAICGNVSTFPWEELIDLLVANELVGTLTVHGPSKVLHLYAQGGLIVTPLPVHPQLGHDRKDDQRRANSELVRALRWPAASFEFVPGAVPPGMILRRAVVLKASRLLSALQVLGQGRGPRAPIDVKRFPLQGYVAGVGLGAILWALTHHRRTGTLLVSSSRGRVTLYLEEGVLYALWRDHGIPGWMVDPCAEQQRLRERVLEACRWKDASLSFLPEQLPQEFARQPLGLRRVGVNTRRVVSDACREAKLEQQRQVSYAASA